MQRMDCNGDKATYCSEMDLVAARDYVVPMDAGLSAEPASRYCTGSN